MDAAVSIPAAHGLSGENPNPTQPNPTRPNPTQPACEAAFRRRRSHHRAVHERRRPSLLRTQHSTAQPGLYSCSAQLTGTLNGLVGQYRLSASIAAFGTEHRCGTQSVLQQHAARVRSSALRSQSRYPRPAARRVSQCDTARRSRLLRPQSESL